MEMTHLTYIKGLFGVLMVFAFLIANGSDLVQQRRKKLPFKTQFSDIDYLCLYENSKF